MTDRGSKPGKQSEGAGKPRRKARPCPICSKMSVEKYHPFCSGRCADIDLHRWLGGRYAIPTQESPETLDSMPPRDEEEG